MMSKLQKKMDEILKELVPDTYHMRAPRKLSGPYLVYHLQSISSPHEYEDWFILDIDGWLKSVSPDPSSLETMLDTLDGDGTLVNASGLHHKVVVEENLIMKFERIGATPLDEKDEYTFHWIYSYQVKVIRNGGNDIV